MSPSAIDYAHLSLAERIQLVEDIWDSIAAESAESHELSPEQKAELDRRLSAHHSDPTSAVPWAQVRKKLFRHT